MIARIWHGVTSPEHYEEYWKFLHDRAIPDYRATPGNKYYPEDAKYLLEFEPTVLHFEATESEYVPPA